MSHTLTVLLFIALFSLTGTAAAQRAGNDTAPGDSCAGIATGAVRVSPDPAGNTASAILVCNGTSWQAAGVQVGNDTATCTTTKQGTLRYTGGTPPWEYCDGSAWSPFRQPRCTDDATGECFLVAEAVCSPGTISNASMSQAGTINNASLDSAANVALSGNYAYVAARNADALTMVDISTPASPAVVGTTGALVSLAGARGVAISGNYAYVASWTADALTVIDTGCALSSRLVNDPDFTAANIRSGVNILGVTGTLSASGGCTAPASCPDVGDVCTDGSLFLGMRVYESACTSLFANIGGITGSFNFSDESFVLGTNSSYDGRANSEWIKANRSLSDYPAFEVCENLVRHGHSDWYLPAQGELVLHPQLSSEEYWTSTQTISPYNPGSDAYLVFGEADGDILSWGDGKTLGKHVSCMRRD